MAPAATASLLMDVRFRGNNGHDADTGQCPLMTQTGHCAPLSHEQTYALSHRPWLSDYGTAKSSNGLVKRCTPCLFLASGSWHLRVMRPLCGMKRTSARMSEYVVR